MNVKKNETKKLKDQFHQEIKTTMADIARIAVSELGNDIRFREELGIDSLMAMEMVAKLEKKFNIKIDETKLEKVNTIGEFINLISNQMN